MNEPDALADSDAILERARTGTRLMTIRGALMRAISIGANLLLLLLVSPAELGLLAVARGTFTLLQYAAELGIGKALLRRPASPTSAEYASLMGLQLLVGTAIVIAGAIWPRFILGFGSIAIEWRWAMLGTVAAVLSLAFGTGARVRLERALAYERLAKVDVFNVLTLNIGLVLFALLHRFSIGVFIVLAVATIAANALLFYWAPGPRPSLNFRPLAGVARQSSGFLVAASCAVIREQGTPVLIGVMFGLPVAGLYSFAERVGQTLNITFEGFRNASIPAAARLGADRGRLRELASRTLIGSATLTAPLAIVAISSLPLIALIVPKWTAAVPLTQWYIVAYATYGVFAAAFEPAAVALLGARVAVSEQASALCIGWAALLLVNALGPSFLPAAVLLMYLAPVSALGVITPADIRPHVSARVLRIAAVFALCVAFYLLLTALRVSAIVTMVAVPALMLATFPGLHDAATNLRARFSRRTP